MGGGVPEALVRLSPVASARRRAALSLRSRVAGERAADRARLIWDSPGERWFATTDPIWWVHADASMFPGGIRALLLQSLHPLAMTAVADHSAYRDDPWARVQNTSAFLAATTFGTVAVAEQAVAAVRRVHATVRGVTPDGRTYSADDPHLLRWVHLAEVESFLTCYQEFGRRRLSPRHADRYVEQTGRVARLLGVVDPPTTEAALRDELAGYRPELAATPPALDVARYLLVTPPLSWAARPGYAALAAGAVATLPGWARPMLRLGPLDGLLAAVGRPVGRAATSTVRWVMADPSVA
jgi:uncharacterized protein (DUF2236 family)